MGIDLLPLGDTEGAAIGFFLGAVFLRAGLGAFDSAVDQCSLWMRNGRVFSGHRFQRMLVTAFFALCREVTNFFYIRFIAERKMILLLAMVIGVVLYQSLWEMVAPRDPGVKRMEKAIMAQQQTNDDQEARLKTHDDTLSLHQRYLERHEAATRKLEARLAQLEAKSV